MKYMLMVVAALLLSACASTAPYQPLDDGVGYSEQKLEANRYRVSFAGNSATPRETVENYLLYRAAELTLNNGYDGFTLAARDTQAQSRSSGPSFGIGFGGIGIGSHTGFGLGVGTGTGGSTEYQGSADIVMFRGKKPAADLRAYDARELKTNLDAQIKRPKP